MRYIQLFIGVEIVTSWIISNLNKPKKIIIICHLWASQWMILGQTGKMPVLSYKNNLIGA